ncbi:hypothetical protein TVAG_117140 [Trichomonas vaginalis G3]|uniref:CYRIA/CYRIB Rac1 binding domain-containing protein n=1 Tax=Trichomonas vaginalis (strain ATCC PRA-98 / G3) TaxID=412133 RepID=A2E3Q4_TRIV3|nr:cytoplasmic FMR1-interacting protein-related family [Trichomonas vaginalis G3]EAY12692.1 hypothetical protein TVAG_117140 [Trichomonas vaginalis G3]KAI5517546.1 cytoplasmic FMR1-interacting protein-related family [Trichomonas vaginalis G3]|eukprot:XP_001324915.1 hypothetical protein [Trichomonas vaginalis G3]
MTENLETVQLDSTSPMSSPNSVFLHIEDETVADHTLYQTISNLSAATELSFCTEANNISNLFDIVLSKIYGRRSVSNILEKRLIRKPENEKQISENVTPILSSTLDIIEKCLEICSKLQTFLGKFLKQLNEPNGIYSDVILTQICNIIYKSVAADQMLIKKSSIKKDINELQKFLTRDAISRLDIRIKSCSNWLSQKLAIEKTLETEFKKYADLSRIINIMWAYLNKILQERSLCQPNLHFAAITSLIFFVNLSPDTFTLMNVIPTIRDYIETNPYVPLYHELSLGSFEQLQSLPAFQSESFTSRSQQPPQIITDLRKEFEDISQIISSYLTRKTAAPNTDFLNAVVRAFKLLNYTKAVLRQQYVEKLAKPPAQPDSFKSYERAIRYGYTEPELSSMLQLLSHCRDLHDLLRSNAPFIYESVSLSISVIWQDFIKHKLAKCYIHTQRDKDKLSEIIETLRSIGTHYDQGEKWSMKEKGMKDEAMKGRISEDLYSPNPQLIEFVRIQVQHLANPYGEYMIKTGRAFAHSQAIRDKEVGYINEFVTSSFDWTDILAFDQLLEQSVVQSDFYFKEVELEVNGVVNFPVKASLPYILAQFALQNYKSPELTELIFYPLSIYDDALNTATKIHKSGLMVEEIKSEGIVCVETLKALISDFTFNAFRAFSTLRQFPDKLRTYVAEKLPQQYKMPISKAYRLRTIIQQNRFHFLAKNINLIQLIAQKVDDNMNNAVIQLFKLAKTHGLTASLAISHGLDALKDAHRLLTENGLPLLPFTSIERSAKNDTFPLGFISEYFKNTTQHLFKEIIPNYTLAINPHRFIPNKNVTLRSESLGSNEIGKIMQYATESSLAFVTVSHFTFFARQCSEGTLALIMKYINSSVEKTYTNFVNAYLPLKSRISRCKDSPYGTAAKGVYAKYESSYKYLQDDTAIDSVLHALQGLGNLFVALEMLDEAFVIKRFSLSHALAVLKSKDDNRKGLEKLFDDTFSKSVATISTTSPDVAKETAGMCLRFGIHCLIKEIMKNPEVLDEQLITDRESCHKMPPFNQMKGFASMWSIIEFVFCLIEANKMPGKDKGLVKYGVGVTCGAAILCLATDQTALAKVLSIGVKISRASNVETEETFEPLVKFNNIYCVVKAAFDWAITFFKPSVEIMKKYIELKGAQE